ncbi:MAG: Spx/MgsR family RNA polymerase-binding regulatory protein [Mongoliitalea sp.]
MKVYGIKNCNTMKKTFDFLESEGIKYTFVDYKKQAPTTDLLKKFAAIVGFEALINKKGTTYRRLSDADKALLETQSSAIEVLCQNSSMIKRPILDNGKGKLVLGFEPEEIVGLR